MVNPPQIAVDARTAWLTTLRPDGSPHTTPIWYVLDAQTVWIATSKATRKVRNINLDSRVSLAIDTTGDAPLVAEGTAVEVAGIAARTDVLTPFAAKYSGWDAADERQYGPRTLLRITISRWLMRA